ncbi:MAG: transglutaminase family protein [Gammaproteobacteria bacterium]
MQEPSLEEEFRAFARAPASAIEGALLVGRLVESEPADRWVADELDRLAAAVAAPRDASALVTALAQAGFGGAETYYAQANSSLAHVLRTRRGIPITLALVVLGVAERLGLSAHGVNFPRHFLVGVDNRLVDPFAMRVLAPGAIDSAIAAQGLERAQALATAGPIDIVLRMLNNLRLLAEEQGDFARALDVSGYQLLVAPDPLPVLVSRTDLWLGAGVPAMARRELEQAIALAGDEVVRDQLGQRLATIAAAPSQLH